MEKSVLMKKYFYCALLKNLHHCFCLPRYSFIEHEFFFETQLFSLHSQCLSAHSVLPCFLVHEPFARIYYFDFFHWLQCNLLPSRLSSIPVLNSLFLHSLPSPSSWSDHGIPPLPSALAKWPKLTNVLPMLLLTTQFLPSAVAFPLDLGYPWGIWWEASEVAQATTPNCSQMPGKHVLRSLMWRSH